MAEKIDQLILGDTAYDIDLPVDNKVRKNTVFNNYSLSYVAGSTTGSQKCVRWYCSGIADGISTITAPYDGMNIIIKMPYNPNTNGAALSINGNTVSEYHPVTYGNTNVATQADYRNSEYLLLTYNASATASRYIEAGTSITIQGVWFIVNHPYTKNFLTDLELKTITYTGTIAASAGTSTTCTKLVDGSPGTNYYLLGAYAYAQSNGAYDNGADWYMTSSTKLLSTGSSGTTMYWYFARGLNDSRSATVQCWAVVAKKVKN